MTQTTQTTQEIDPSVPGGLALPANALTGRPYQGGNVLRLAGAAIENGWRDMRFGGYNQLQDAGYQVRRGETSTEILVVIGRSRDAGTADDAGGPAVVTMEIPAQDGARERWTGVRTARVFCVEQCDRLDAAQVAEIQKRRAERAEARKAKGGKRKSRKGRKKK